MNRQRLTIGIALACILSGTQGPGADLTGEDPGVRSVLMFGTAEQVRNLCALNHFCTADVFGSCIIPWGPTCST